MSSRTGLRSMLPRQQVAMMTIAVIGLLFCADAVVNAVSSAGSPRQQNAARPTATPSATMPVAPTLTSTCTGYRCTLHGSGAPRGTTLRWNFGDGTSLRSTRVEVSHLYRKAGTYPAQVVAVLAKGPSSAGRDTVRLLDYRRTTRLTSSAPLSVAVSVTSVQPACRSARLALQLSSGTAWHTVSSVLTGPKGKASASVTVGGRYRARAASSPTAGGVCTDATSQPVTVAAPRRHHQRPSPTPVPVLTPTPAPTTSEPSPQPTHSSPPQPPPSTHHSGGSSYSPPPPRP